MAAVVVVGPVAELAAAGMSEAGAGDLVEAAREESLVRMDSGTLLPGTGRKAAVGTAWERWSKGNQSCLGLGLSRRVQ